MTGYQSKKAMSQDKLNDDDDTQVYGDAVDNNPVHEAMLFYWGERCSAYHEECACCQAWEQYDGKTSAQPAQEPVAVKHMMEWVDYLKCKSDYGQHMQIPSGMSAGACWELAIELEQFIDTASPQRPWVGLTKDDTLEIAERLGLADVAWLDLMVAIETKLKERNA